MIGAVGDWNPLALGNELPATPLQRQSPIARAFLVLALLQGRLPSCRTRDVAAAHPEIHA